MKSKSKFEKELRNNEKVNRWVFDRYSILRENLSNIESINSSMYWKYAGAIALSEVGFSDRGISKFFDCSSDTVSSWFENIEEKIDFNDDFDVRESMPKRKQSEIIGNANIEEWKSENN